MSKGSQFVVGGLVKCVRASGSSGVLVANSTYTVAHISTAYSLELKEVPWPNSEGIKFWDYERFEPYAPMDSTEYDDTLAGQAIYRDLEGG